MLQPTIKVALDKGLIKNYKYECNNLLLPNHMILIPIFIIRELAIKFNI